MKDEFKKRYSAALDMMANDCYVDSADAMKKILIECPDFLDVYEGLAMVLSHQGKFDDAIQIIQQLIVRDPENIMAHASLSVLFMKKGMIEAAEEAKAKATVLQFSNAKKK